MTAMVGHVCKPRPERKTTPMTTTCTGPECTREAVTRAGLCHTHDRQRRRIGTMTPLPPNAKPVKPCIGPGHNDQPCGRPAKARGLCVTHDSQRKKGNTLTPRRERATTGGPCTGPASQEGGQCGKPVYSRNLCTTHYAQNKKGQELRPLDAPRPTCSGPDCTRTSVCVGLCNAHYTQQSRGQELRPLRVRHDRTCKVCGAPHWGKGLCQQHYDQARREQAARARPAKAQHVGQRRTQKPKPRTVRPMPDTPAAKAVAAGLPATWFNETAKKAPTRSGGEVSHDTIGTPIPTTPEQAHNAALVVAGHASDATELAELLDMLGLTETIRTTKAA